MGVVSWNFAIAAPKRKKSHSSEKVHDQVTAKLV